MYTTYDYRYVEVHGGSLRCHNDTHKYTFIIGQQKVVIYLGPVLNIYLPWEIDKIIL